MGDHRPLFSQVLCRDQSYELGPVQKGSMTSNIWQPRTHV